MAPPPEQKSNNDDAVVSTRSEIVPSGDVEKTASAPPDNVNNRLALPAGEAAANSNTLTPREQVTAVAEPVTAAAAVPAPDQKADSGDPSDRSETIGLGDTKKAESAPPYNVARLDPAGNAVADSNTRTIQQQVTAATVIAEHVVTLRDAEKAASGSPSNTDQMVVVLIARPEINAISDLTGKDIAIDDRYSASSDKVRTAIAAAGAAEVQLSEGQTEGDRTVDPWRSASCSFDFAVSRNRVSPIRGIQDLPHPTRASLTDRAALVMRRNDRAHGRQPALGPDYSLLRRGTQYNQRYCECKMNTKSKECPPRLLLTPSQTFSVKSRRPSRLGTPVPLTFPGEQWGEKWQRRPWSNGRTA